MGQLVAVTEKPGATAGIVRFETNRSFTGMGHERFTSEADAWGPSPSAEVARRLFATGRVEGVHVYSNMITVDLMNGHTSEGMADMIRELYRYWKPGMQPPTFEDLQPDEAGDETAAGEVADGGGVAVEGDAGLTAAAKLVPLHLLERGRAARERWRTSNS